MKQKYLYLILTILILLGFVSTAVRTVPAFYYMKNFDITNGVISKVEKRNSIEADVSFDYFVDYKVENRVYSLVYVSSEVMQYNNGDSIKVKYSKRKPEYAKLYGIDIFDREMVITVLLFVCLIVFGLKVIKDFFFPSISQI